MSTVSPTETIAVSAAPPHPHSHFWDGNRLGFTDILSAINPLQHLPIIGTIYRAVTGDTIGNVARVVGDTIYGGVIGLASGLIDVASIESTGKDVGQHVVATAKAFGDEIGGMFGPGTAKKPDPAPAFTPLLAMTVPDPPKLPLLGSAKTAGELAAAAPISPLLAPRLAAQVEAQARDAAPPASSTPDPTRPPTAPGAIRPLVGAPRGIAIDVSDQGIARLRALSAAHNPQPVALSLSGGALATPQPASLSAPVAAQQTANQLPPASAGDFAERMREGLAKYDALVAARARDGAAGGIDQQH
jgi:hypothetical protein